MTNFANLFIIPTRIIGSSFMKQTHQIYNLPPIAIGITIYNLTVYIRLFHNIFGSVGRNTKLS